MRPLPSRNSQAGSPDITDISPEIFCRVSSRPQCDMKKHGLGPRVFKSLEFGFILNGVGEEPADRKNHGNEAKKISKRHERGCLSAICPVLLCRCVTESDLLLIVEPISIVRAQRHFNHQIGRASCRELE